MSKDFVTNIPDVKADQGDLIAEQTLTSSSTTASSFTLQTNTNKIFIRNLGFRETVTYTGRARVSLTSGGCADGKRYSLLESGAAIELSCANKDQTTLYYCSDDGTAIALEVIEGRI